MLNEFSRTELLIGKENVKKITQAKVAIFGIGGVGSYVAEGLARAGVLNFILVDNDKIETTNINRQIHATHSTIGKYKVDAMKDRILDISPDAKVEVHKTFFMPNDNGDVVLDNTIDYIVDAIDTVTSKIELVMQAQQKGINIICAMGTANKLDPTKFEITDIYKTSVCPLAKALRKELRARGVKHLKVLYSKEEPIKSNQIDEKTKRVIPGSISYVPSVAGLIIAGEVIKDIINKGENDEKRTN